MVNYLSKFSVRLSELAEPIRELSEDKVLFNWGPEHQAAFKQMKGEIVRAPVLAFYIRKKETILQTNASIKGLGACFLQDQKPVYFASSVYRNTRICGHRNWITSCSMGNGEVSPQLAHKPFHLRNRSKNIGGHLIQMSKPSKTKAAKNSDKNISL